MARFGKRSQENLVAVHPILVSCATLALRYVDFTVICGHRPKYEQEAAYARGTTKVHFPNSPHNQIPALAIDVIPYPFKGWDDFAGFEKIFSAMERAAKEMEIQLRWGGDFNRDGPGKGKDGWDKPHFELHPWRNWRNLERKK